MILRTSGIGVSIAFLREAQWGSRGREFDSRHSDHKSNDFTLEIVGFFLFIGWPHLVLTTILTTMPTILSGLISAVPSNFQAENASLNNWIALCRMDS